MYVYISIALIALCISNVNGTSTPNIEEIFLGRCWEYQRVINPEPFVEGEKNCTELWVKFRDAFAYKEPCASVPGDYEDFAEAANHDVPANKALFWESMYPFVNFYSNRGLRFTTIADTLLGYMADFLVWCGQTEDPGINFDSCPTWSQCEAANGMMPDYAYWMKVSTYFSTESSGQTFVMLNGSFLPAFDNNSIFATYELVNLTPEKGVTQLNIWLMHDIGGLVQENCGAGSLLQLEDIAINQGLTVTCTNNQLSVKLMQCVDAPNAPECLLVKEAAAVLGNAATTTMTPFQSLTIMATLLPILFSC